MSPILAFEMDWISRPYSSHGNRASVAIGESFKLICHGSCDCLCLAAYFASVVVFSHGHPPID
jgi:hypothetical protein